MSTHAAAYEALIQGLCESAGIERWSEVAAVRHIQIGDQLIGLIPDLERDAPTLSIYLELGQTFPERDAALYERMLVANLQSDPDMPGHFGLHPESRQAVYTLNMRLDAVSGAELAELLDAQVGSAARRMESLSHA